MLVTYNTSTLEELISILKKGYGKATVGEAVLLAHHLTPSQLATPKHTLLMLLIEWGKRKGFSLDIARSLASVDQSDSVETWRLA